MFGRATIRLGIGTHSSYYCVLLLANVNSRSRSLFAVPRPRLSVVCNHSLANWDSCPTTAKSEATEYLQVGPTEIRYSIAWTIF